MDIGIWMTAGTLESKLEQQETGKPEAAWNLSRWPQGFSEDPKQVNRLFVASNGQWVGYFHISPEMLYLPEEDKTPYVLLFDTRTWQDIPPIPVKRFRGFTYKVPREAAPGKWATPAPSPSAKDGQKKK
jgi:hypothetical protein